ncbi:putative methyltransferase C9orf114 homolog isoform X2 [Pyxicephalus adspersus]|uniref:putative methyltransferase C9orf114 homolog isoform X2 n=1 Tax=Pyxicephalus adspersus TaxID=30357 RepID=UPI003B597A42
MEGRKDRDKRKEQRKKWRKEKLLKKLKKALLQMLEVEKLPGIKERRKYLRKSLFPKHPDLQLAGLLNPPGQPSSYENG